jgi:hypothetical protein
MHLGVFSTAQIPGLLLPFCVCAYLALTGKSQGFNFLLFLLFIVSTTLDVSLAHWTVSLNCRSLSGYPVCALSILCLSLFFKETRPSAGLGYSMVFFSELVRDLVCGFHYALANQALTLHFFHGVGGAGWMDGLFLQPLFTALGIKLINQLPRFENRYLKGSFLAKPLNLF